MYPETDLELLKISRQKINQAKKTLPKLRSDIKQEMKKQGLNPEMIKQLIKQEKIQEYKNLNQIINDPKFIAKTLLVTPKEVGKHENKENYEKILTTDVIESIILEIKKGTIQKTDVKHVMTQIIKGKPFQEAIKIQKTDISELEGEIAKIVKEKPGLSIGGYMGIVMGKFKGGVDGKTACEILKKLIK